MTTFLMQNYEPKTIQVQYTSPELLAQTDASQADDVRSILSRFAITGIATGRDPSRDSYIGQMSDDVPADDKTVNDMLDFPDLSYMDEMEVKDYINDNVSLTEEEAASPAAPPSEPPSEPRSASMDDSGSGQ